VSGLRVGWPDNPGATPSIGQKLSATESRPTPIPTQLHIQQGPGSETNHWPVSDIPIKNAWGRVRRLFQRPILPAPFLSIPVLQSTWSILLILLAHHDLCPLNGAGYRNFYSPRDETWCGGFNHSVGLKYIS